jgi:hypothetical protein
MKKNLQTRQEMLEYCRDHRILLSTSLDDWPVRRAQPSRPIGACVQCPQGSEADVVRLSSERSVAHNFLASMPRYCAGARGILRQTKARWSVPDESAAQAVANHQSTFDPLQQQRRKAKKLNAGGCLRPSKHELAMLSYRNRQVWPPSLRCNRGATQQRFYA